MDDSSLGFEHLTETNRALLKLAFERERLFRLDPERLTPIFFRPCRVRVLLVADGGLDFSVNDFGLRTFVEILRTTPPGPYVRFDITIAHINSFVSDDQVMVGYPGIVRSIKGFKFDDPDDFKPDMYDQVWLFGISTFYSRGAGYPSNRLSDAELRALSEFMNGGGGLFATGDHGALGVCLSGSIPRARSMRLWGDTSPNNNLNEVSMNGARRNDTNRIGHDAGSQFNDQSDDVPQTIQPKMYYRWGGVFRYSYPHPLLCGPLGMIRVMPDHPHEGECVEPTNTSRTDMFNGYPIEEYPAGSGGSPRPLPEVITISSVPAGNNAGGTKNPTQPHTFGGICAYDGHYAAVGRVVTDATWHHFVNVNLDGETGAAPPKNVGFLATALGQAHLENIKAYYRNIAVWISRPAQINCMNQRIIWGLIWQHRAIEAVATRLDIKLDQINVEFLYEVGRHARDVLGNYASQCQSRRIIIDILRPFIREDLLIRLDPWRPMPEQGPEPDPLPWIDVDPILEVALGGALIALREKFPEPDPKIRDQAEKDFDNVLNRGVKFALDLAKRTVDPSAKRFVALW